MNYCILREEMKEKNKPPLQKKNKKLKQSNSKEEKRKKKWKNQTHASHQEARKKD